MKLFIDDIRQPPDNTWHICRSVGAAIRALDAYYREIDEIQLDHDISHQVVLGGMSRPYPCEETFETVARYIAMIKKLDRISPLGTDQTMISWNPKITIHTSNPDGADRMKAILESVGLKPIRQIAPGANRLEMHLP